MADEFIVVNSSQQIFYYNEEKFYEHINEVGKSALYRTNYIFLSKFPLPNSNTTTETVRQAKDSKGRSMGRFCPFGDDKSWPANALLVLKNGTIFIPQKATVTKVVEEYVANTDTTSAPKLSIPTAGTKTVAKRIRK